jgi:membrane protein DedA with SNARE-associated domain
MLTFALHIHLLHNIKGPTIDYVGVAVAAFASWVGVPGPGEPVLIAAGIVAAKHKLDVTPVVFAAWMGANAGGIVGWLIGMKAGRSVLTARGPLLGLRQRAVARGEQVFRRFEVIAIVLTPSWIAGVHHARARAYLPTNALSALVLWAAPIGLGAYFAGPPVLDVVNDAGTVAFVALVALVIGVLAVGVARRFRRPSASG